MEYRCISADCHMDVSWLPHDLFVSNASPAMKDRMPYVTQGPDGPRWTTRSGLNLGLANGKGSPGATGGGGNKYVPGKEHRLDRVASTGLFSEASRTGICRPSTPALRIQDQDRDGIQAEVVYGLLGTGNRLTDREAAVEFYRIYNDWLEDFCGYDRKRLIGLASIPSHGVDVAIAEVKRVSKLKLGGLDVPVAYDMLPLWDPLWDPFWATAEDGNLAVHFHTIGPPPSAPVRQDLPAAYKDLAMATKMAGFQLNTATILSGIIFGGVLERHPKLRIVFGESGIGWIPYVIDRMDCEYEGRLVGRIPPLKLKPSEYWHRQCRATFQNDRIGTKLLDDLGVENVMWGSDYPHSDGVFPDSQEHIERQFGQLPSTIRRKITCENAGKFYGLM